MSAPGFLNAPSNSSFWEAAWFLLWWNEAAPWHCHCWAWWSALQGGERQCGVRALQAPHTAFECATSRCMLGGVCGLIAWICEGGRRNRRHCRPLVEVTGGMQRQALVQHTAELTHTWFPHRVVPLHRSTGTLAPRFLPKACSGSPRSWKRPTGKVQRGRERSGDGCG